VLSVNVQGESVAGKANQIMDLVAEGEISIEAGERVLQALLAVTRIREADELAVKVEQLEAKIDEFARQDRSH
jgi:polyhydroxyalkanoate synthesis regulator phasin